MLNITPPICILPEEVFAHHIVPLLTILDVVALSKTCRALHRRALHALRYAHRMHRVYALPQPFALGDPDAWVAWLSTTFPSRTALSRHIASTMTIAGPDAPADITFLGFLTLSLPIPPNIIEGMCLGIIRVVLREHHLLGAAIEATEVLGGPGAEAHIEELFLQQRRLYHILFHLLASHPQLLLKSPHLCEVFFQRVCRAIEDLPRESEDILEVTLEAFLTLPSANLPTNALSSLLSTLSFINPSGVAIRLKTLLFRRFPDHFTPEQAVQLRAELRSFHRRWETTGPQSPLEEKWGALVIGQMEESNDLLHAYISSTIEVDA
jgi:hypothetical protein